MTAADVQAAFDKILADYTTLAASDAAKAAQVTALAQKVDAQAAQITSLQAQVVALTPVSEVTAAVRYGWGTPVAADEFDRTALGSSWWVYNSAGHGGNGLRRPSQVTIKNGVLRIDGTAGTDQGGVSGGCGTSIGSGTYGRWEARMRTSPHVSAYHPVLLLWPDGDNWSNGEIDFAELDRGDGVSFYLHDVTGNPSRNAASGSKKLDTTAWHTYAVEWTAGKVTVFIDGEIVLTSTDKAAIPSKPMHLCVQLDNFGNPSGPAWMEVDWVRKYAA